MGGVLKCFRGIRACKCTEHLLSSWMLIYEF